MKVRRIIRDNDGDFWVVFTHRGELYTKAYVHTESKRDQVERAIDELDAFIQARRLAKRYSRLKRREQPTPASIAEAVARQYGVTLEL